ncbi:alpha/beta fold hydrolase [Candidatus Bathyarchaeota archaeon]|nr:alpha/beta fold hydrolase [Candidatus Bathyarchaeota archaeon]
MPTANVNGIEVYHETHGRGSPLTLINGWGGNLDSWSKQMITALAERHRVITMDNRGTGRSGKPDEPYTMDMLAADVAGLLDALSVEKSHVMGFSMGGIVAQTVALNHPGKVRSLVLCGANPGGLHRVGSSVHVQTELALIASPLPEMTERDRTVKLLYLLYPRWYVEANLEELIQDETYSDHPTPDYALVRQSQAIAGFHSHDRLPTIKAPTLVMTGEEDILVPPGNSEILADRIPGAELVKIPGAGHGFLKQKTAEAMPVILGFLEKVDRG